MNSINAKNPLITGIALLCAALFSMPGSVAADKYFGQISVAPNAVHVAGEEAFAIQAPAGGFSVLERTLIVERNVSNALMGSTNRTPSAVVIEQINNIPVIRIGGFHIVTADSESAKFAGTTMQALAEDWANGIKRALSDEARVNQYVAQLSGDFLGSSMTTPYRRARCEAARLNHAPPLFKETLPLGLISSDSTTTQGMKALLVDRDPAAAEYFFRKAIAASSENSRAHYGLGVCLLKQGRVDSAIDSLQMARWLEPDYAMVHLALGQAFETQGKAVDAVKQYREAALLQPDNPEPYLLIADVREDRNDIGKSVTELTPAVFKMPESQYLSLRRKDQMAWRLFRPY